MPSIRQPESIAKLTKASSTTVSLPASRINIGGQQYVTLQSVSLSTATIGAGGLDATAQATTRYYVYAVISNGAVALIGSTSATAPAGFSQARIVGHFYSDANAGIDRALFSGQLDAEISSVAAEPSASNYIINSNFNFWQRGLSGILTATDTAQYKAADRWFTYRTGSTALTQSRQAGDISQYSCKAQRTPGDTGTTACYMGYTMETSDLLRLAGKVVTLSFNIKAGANYSPSGSAMSLLVITGTGTDQGSQAAIAGSWTGWAVPASKAMTLTTTSTRISFTFLVPAAAKEMNLLFQWSPTGTAGADDSFTLEQVMLNEGYYTALYSLAGKTIAEELALCQRYYEKSYAVDVLPATGSVGGAFWMKAASTITGYNWGSIIYRVVKRSTPTVAFYSIAGSAGKASDGDLNDMVAGSASPNGSITSTTGILIQNTSGGTLTPSGSALSIHWTADCEL